MRDALSAGGASRESVANVQSLLGTLELARGHRAAAASAHRAALAALPGYPAAEAGLARVAAARGDLAGAIRRWRSLSRRLPLPEYVIGLGEAQLAAGREAAGARELELVGAQERLSAGGVNVDAELAVFEADHGSPDRALALAERAWRAAPGLRAADARGWALTRGGRPAAGLRWAHRALRLGSRDAIFRYHTGIAALAAGREGEGRRHLRLALSHGLEGWPWQAAQARDALAEGVRR
jgi:tetratricopeptide (TPR) repeat protein